MFTILRQPLVLLLIGFIGLAFVSFYLFDTFTFYRPGHPLKVHAFTVIVADSTDRLTV